MVVRFFLMGNGGKFFPNKEAVDKRKKESNL